MCLQYKHYTYRSHPDSAYLAGSNIFFNTIAREVTHIGIDEVTALLYHPDNNSLWVSNAVTLCVLQYHKSPGKYLVSGAESASVIRVASFCINS